MLARASRLVPGALSGWVSLEAKAPQLLLLRAGRRCLTLSMLGGRTALPEQ